MTPEEILAKAAEDQATYGHHKEQFYSVSAASSEVHTAPACAYGSIARVSGALEAAVGTLVNIEGYGVPLAARRLADQIRLEEPNLLREDDYTTITHFNDRESTSSEDVALMMKKAAHHG